MSWSILHTASGACAIVVGITLASAALAQPHTAQSAKDYPNKPIRLVVPAAPGGGTDIIARLIAQELGEAWGQSVVVDNRGGGGGTVGVTVVAKAAPDGYTMLLGSVGHLTFVPVVRPGLPYDSQKDLAPISLAANQPFLIAVNPLVPAKSIKELIALAKSRPGQIKYGSGGPEPRRTWGWPCWSCNRASRCCTSRTRAATRR